MESPVKPANDAEGKGGGLSQAVFRRISRTYFLAER